MILRFLAWDGFMFEGPVLVKKVPLALLVLVELLSPAAAAAAAAAPAAAAAAACPVTVLLWEVTLEAMFGTEEEPVLVMFALFWDWLFSSLISSLITGLAEALSELIPSTGTGLSPGLGWVNKQSKGEDNYIISRHYLNSFKSRNYPLIHFQSKRFTIHLHTNG